MRYYRECVFAIFIVHLSSVVPRVIDGTKTLPSSLEPAYLARHAEYKVARNEHPHSSPPHPFSTLPGKSLTTHTIKSKRFHSCQEPYNLLVV
jgi:hypothetical protein